MNKELVIHCSEYTTYIRNAGLDDLENLRVWKNANKESFFYRDEITREMQLGWYEGYLGRDSDYMFIVENDDFSLGCMAFRLRDGYIDLYNIIRGNDSNLGKMHEGMYIMLNYILRVYGGYIIRCDVIKGNRAKKWYEKCGFRVVSEIDYYIMSIEDSRIPKLNIKIVER